MAEQVATTQKPIYQGTDLKFQIDIVTEGFDMDADDFKVVIKNGSKSEKVITKGEMLVTENDKYLFTLNTAELGTGEYVISTFAYVPDSDFDSGIRTEVTKQTLCVVTS